MKKALISAVLAVSTICAFASTDNTPRWLRQSAISPDGNTVVFVYQGDLYSVPATGGQARQLTTNPAHDTEPVWTPDGKHIVFASYREGSKDIWAMPAEGGTPVRLTTYNGVETPLAVGSDGLVYFKASIQEDPVSSMFPGDGKLYAVDLNAVLAAGDDEKAQAKARKPRQITSIPVENMSVNSSGTIIYEDWKGYEDEFRKHHTSAVTRDIWKRDASGTYTKLTKFVGEDRNPVFASDGHTYYYLSEMETGNEAVDSWAGDSNVWKADINGVSPVKITSFKGNPVRFLSISKGGTLCFSYNGDLYTCREGSQPQKIAITLIKDKNNKDKFLESVSGGARDVAVSPNGKEIAVVVRGDVYVTGVGFNSTRRITETPEQERTVSFGKDGKVLFYDSERDGNWGVYKVELPAKDKFFSLSYDFKEELFSGKGETCFQPVVSPDGKKVAYLRDRSEIVVKNASGGGEKSFLKGVNYSYSDGDLRVEWSPDGKYLLANYMAGGRMYNTDIALINVESGEITDLTESGYSDENFHWALGGKAMTWETDMQGYRSHGSWGAEGDVYAMFFDAEAYSEFTRSKDIDEIEKVLEDKGDKWGKRDDSKKDSAEVEKPKSLKLLLEGREDRVVRLTPSSSRLGDHYLTPDGSKLLYFAPVEKGMALCSRDIKKGDVKVLKRDFRGNFLPSADGKSLFVVGNGGIYKLDAAKGSTEPVKFSGEFEYEPAKEREYIFYHCWKQVKEKFYDPDMHGVDWDAQKANYEQFLPYINDNFAFRELLSEMLGELNGSHTGARYRAGSKVNVGHIGVIFDDTYTGKGLKVKEFLPGSALLTAAPELKEGAIITAIDGKEIEEGTEWYDALAMKSGKQLLLSVKGQKKDIYVKAASNDSDALYKRWVRRNVEKVKELSGGKIGYVHIQGMNSPSYRELYSKALGKYRECDALIVDTRHNGGGWLHDDVVTFLGGKVYTNRTPRGVYMAPEPYNKWTKPSCMLVCEDNYSDACGTPYAYRALGLGKIIGSPVPGTATSVWWEYQVDRTLVFGIPQIGSNSTLVGRYLENLQLQPDILIYNDPASFESGEDPQLEAAVKEMLREVSKTGKKY